MSVFADMARHVTTSLNILPLNPNKEHRRCANPRNPM